MNIVIKILQRLFPQGCGNGHPWDPATCYGKALCGRSRIATVILDHNGEIFEMACSDEHTKPMKTWTTVTLDPPVMDGIWRHVERHPSVRAARADRADLVRRSAA